ncbi:MAG: type II toxin-antitoxin system VapC family toxin [Acidobacteriota bacterium]
MSRYCLDTSAYSQLRRGEPQVTDLIDTAEWIGVPAVTLGELHAGFACGRRRRENEQTLEDFLADPVVVTLAVDHSVARIFGEVIVDLRRAGTPVPTNDAWIAAQTIREGATVLTFDRHFRKIPRVSALVLTVD